MNPGPESREDLPKPPDGYLKHLGELALGGGVVIVAAITHLPDVAAIPLMVGGGVAAVHGSYKAFEVAINTED